MVYLHGFQSVRKSEKSDALANMARTRGLGFACFDFRAHGESVGVALKDITLQGMLADAEYVTDGLPELGALHLVGSSIGALIALKMSATSERVKSAVLVAGAGGLVRRWAELPIEDGCFKLESSFVGDSFISKGFFEGTEAWTDEVLGQNTAVPVLAVHGVKDDCVPLEDARHLFSCLPESVPKQWVCYPEGGHRLNENITDTYRTYLSFLETNKVEGI